MSGTILVAGSALANSTLGVGLAFSGLGGRQREADKGHRVVGTMKARPFTLLHKQPFETVLPKKESCVPGLTRAEKRALL